MPPTAPAGADHRAVSYYIRLVLPSQARILHYGRPIAQNLRLALEPRYMIVDATNSLEMVDVVIVTEDYFHGQVIARVRGTYPKSLIVGSAAREVAIFERMQWIRSGADDLLPEENLEAGITRLLSRQRVVATPPTVTVPDAHLAVERYLVELIGYLGQREQLLSRLGAGAQTRFVDLMRRRDAAVQTLLGSPQDLVDDATGLPRWEGPRCTWPMSVRLPYFETGQVLRFGADTLQIVVPGVISFRDRLQIRVEAGTTVALVDLEMLWPLATAGGRSVAAGVITDCALDRPA